MKKLASRSNSSLLKSAAYAEMLELNNTLTANLTLLKLMYRLHRFNLAVSEVTIAVHRVLQW